MKYLITLFLLIPSALTAMNEGASAPKLKPIEVNIRPVLAHVRADKGQRTIFCSSIVASKHHVLESINTYHSRQVNNTQITLTEIIPNDAAQQLTVLFSLKHHKNKRAYDGLMIATYGSRIPLGDQQSDVRYFLDIPDSTSQRPKDQCDCPTQEHKNDLAAALAWVLAQPSAESDTEKLNLTTDALAQLTIAPNDQGDDVMKK